MIKKTLSVLMLGVMLVLTLGFAAASASCSSEKTIIAGVVYYGDDISNVVSGANVLVVCHHNDQEKVLPLVVSDLNGMYSVSFDANECDYLDVITVIAEKGALEGTNEGQITNEYTFACLKLNAGNVNVPVVPEFGTVVGILTALGALGIFFVVRRSN